MGLAFILALFGFAALAIAMRRHHRDLFGVEPSRQGRVILHAVGALGLAASYGHLCLAWGAVEGTIDWLCLASLAAIVIVAALGAMTRLRRAGPRNGALR
ncbi:DUF3325 domain-containing protein [Terriglobus saanensis]|uniref:Putative iron uptake protein n=1 Tax=Terriglobus saanensis (strain ATCC BAA-1853 / DSM 23119 / SP1PR4) TaxID=401053 RepID=E8V4C8_TERSS|nr:DUF3325 domain-containing protein [Terriglobus saanensis]ADV83677.1 putative iron uptake protein [Terriglobus saanensis SP1PR4]